MHGKHANKYALYVVCLSTIHIVFILNYKFKTLYAYMHACIIVNEYSISN